MIQRRAAHIFAFWTFLLGALVLSLYQEGVCKYPALHYDYYEEDLFRGRFSLDDLGRGRGRLSFSVTPIITFSDLEIKLFLSEGIEHKGDLNWRGEVAGDSTISLNLEISFSLPGVYTVRAYVRGEHPEGYINKSYFLYIIASETDIQVTPYPVRVSQPLSLSLGAVTAEMEQRPQRIEERWEENRGASYASISATNTVTITGRWMYMKDDGLLSPVRRARVRVYEEGIIDVEIGAGHTDDNGYYVFVINVSGSKNIYVKIECESVAAKVTDGNVFNISYWGRTPTKVISQTDPLTWDIGSYYFESSYANWQALDYTLDEYIWLNSRAGWARSQVIIEWPVGDWPSSDGNRIYLPDKAIADWNRGTVLHEYAHCVMYAAYGNRWPRGRVGGAHTVWSENIGLPNGILVPGDGGFALVEGWAEFMQAAVDNNPGNLAVLSPQADLDQDGIWGTARLSFINGRWIIEWDDRNDARLKNIENNEWWMGENYRPDNLGSIVEGAVASIFWDIFDDRGDDDLYEGFGKIWTVLLNNKPDDIIAFRKHYLEENPSADSGLCSVFDHHGIPCLKILSPTEISPIYAGPNNSPNKIVVKVVTDYGLSQSDFIVSVGNKVANIITIYEAKGVYLLEVMPPTQSSNGLYSLQITTKTRTAIEANAVYYANANNIDVALVIDRSGSMGTDKMNAAKDAAKQFVDLMHYGDMVGVVSFDDIVETNFPLTTIERPYSVPPLFSDDMESGTGKWIADAPWGLTTSSSHTPSHSWTDSPSGNYGNNINVALRTAAPIYISTVITTPVLSFWQKYALESGYDNGYIEISTDGGNSWTQLGSHITGSNLTWHQVERDLSAYKGQNVLVRFRIQTDSSITDDGWYIDDVKVGQSSADVKAQAKSAIDSLYSRGLTSIGGGLQRGQEQLTTRGNPSHPWAIVLLSDGLENTAPYVRDVLPAIEASKTVVHTIGLGADADEALMMDIASRTGGTYHFAPTSQELAGIYNTIAGAVANRQTLFVARGVAQQGVTDQKDVVVDSTVSEATFSVSWSNRNSTISLVLRKPNGQIIDPIAAGGDPNVEYVAGSTYVYYRIQAPTLTPGVWQMRITGGSVTAAGEKGIIASTSGESYVARVTGQSSLTMRFYLDRDNYLTMEPMRMIVTLSDYQPVRNAVVNVVIQWPSQSAQAIPASDWIAVNGDTVPDPVKMAELRALSAQTPVTITLYDDGFHGDGLAGDGVYANTFFGTDSAGTWVFSASASGTSNTGEAFARYADISTYIAQNPYATIHRVYLPAITRNYGTGVVYNWLDATNGGTIVAQGDDTYQYVSLPFPFRFYGNTYTGVYVSSNGFVSFGSGYTNYRNSCIPSTDPPNNAIYAFWADLVPTGGSNGNIYVKQTDNDTFVIEWHRVRKYQTTDYQTFEIVLKRDHSIILQYQSITGINSVTVGVENATGTSAQQHICNGVGSPLTNLMAIRYTTP